MIAEYSASNVLLRRYVHGPGTDNPVVWYEGTGIADKRYMIADVRGSITGIVKQDGSLLAINAYDEYGIPAATNVGRFGYTGQTWLPEIGMNYYKARIYSPTLGRFMQSDPIGFGGGMNLYAYVGGDPVNFSDPSGLYAVGVRPTPHRDPLAPIVVTGGRRVRPDCSSTLNDVCIDNLGGLIDLLQARGNSLNFNRQRDGAIVVRGVRKKKRLTRTSLRIKPRARLSVGERQIGFFGVVTNKPRPADWCGSVGSERTPDGNWGEACAAHDKCYASSGATKEACDVKLARDITVLCSARGTHPGICATIGTAYGEGLMILGWTPFWHPSRDAFDAAQND
jgi:RHS repeat-associated protein